MARFKLGNVVCTRGVFSLMQKGFDFNELVKSCLARHSAGDWGNMCEEDIRENERALAEGNRLFSAYSSEGHPKIWIITEADRSSTCILFPDEY